MIPSYLPVVATGSNEYGQLGAGLAANQSTTPVEVAGNHTFAAISCTNMHTCALEPPPSSRAWCWGVRRLKLCDAAGCLAGCLDGWLAGG